MLTLEQMCEKLRSSLSIKRYIHTLGVMEEAKKLARVYGVSEEKAEIAGLLHDCAKDYPNQLKINLCKEYHVKLDDFLLNQPELIHSFLGAEVAKRVYQVQDSEILNSIKYHTTGKPDMSALEKIIYVADGIEPNRKDTEFIKNIRELAYEDLDKAFSCMLKDTIRHLKKRRINIYYLTVEALEYMKKQEAIC